MCSQISLLSLLWNLTILSGLIYGVWLSINTIQATLTPEKEYCMNSVATSYKYITFSGPGYDSYFAPRCVNPTRLVSTYASGKRICTAEEVDIGFEAIRKECASRGLELLDWQDLVANITDEDIDKMKIVDFDELPKGQNVTEPVLISQSMFERIDNTLTTWEYEVKWHHRSGFILYGFWAMVLIVAATNHILEMGGQSITASTKSSQSHSILNRCRRWIKTNLIIPPAFGSYHQRLFFWCTIPTRMESVIVFAFYLLATYLSLDHYRTFENNIYWDDKSQQLWRYVADRTGIMSYATLPLIWIFAGRNNVFMWATGLTYQAFNIYHRHIARVGTVLAIVHSIVYTWLYIKFEGLDLYTAQLFRAWFALGIAATIAMSLLLLFSISWLRVKLYEVFLVLHIALSFIVLIGCFMHTSIFSKEYDAYLWPLVVVWVLDRALRLARLTLCNFRVRFSRNIIHRARTTVLYSKASNVIRLDIAIDSPLIQPASGHFYQIYQPTTWQGFENHPFTLGAWSSSGNSEDDSGSPLLARSGSEQDDEFDAERDDTGLRAHGSSPVAHTLTFFIRPYDGWTKRLRDECLQSPTHTFRPFILIEGPYGHHHDLTAFDNILLIAGGTGIASAIPYILEHIDAIKTANTRTKRVKLLWTTRQTAFIHEIFERELCSPVRRDDFEAELFCTQDPSSVLSSRRANNDGTKTQGEALREAGLEIQYKRPNVAEMIRDAANAAKGRGQRLAVLVCGPPAMADEARIAVYHALRRGCDSVEYFEESFGW